MSKWNQDKKCPYCGASPSGTANGVVFKFSCGTREELLSAAPPVQSSGCKSKAALRTLIEESS